MTLHKYEGEWKIDFFTIDNYRSYQISFSKHIEASKVDSNSRNKIEDIINQILSDSSKL